MKLTIQAATLLNQLQAVIGAIPTKAQPEILTHVLINAQTGRLTLTGYNLQLQLVASQSCSIDEPGALTTPAKKLLDILKSLPSTADVKLDAIDGKLVLRAMRSRFSLSTMPAGEFPNVEQIATPIEVQISQQHLQRILKKTAHAMGVNDVRYYLNGVNLDLQDNRLRAVATDGHRMAIAGAEVDSTGETMSCILPDGAANNLSSLLTNSETEITLRLGSQHFHAELPFGDSGRLDFISSLIDGKFPNYNRVIPSRNDKTILATREDLCIAIARVGLVANKYKGMRWELTPDCITVSCTDGSEEASETVTVEYAGTPLELGFNFGYLLDALKTISATTVNLSLGDVSSSAMITDPNDASAMYIVMPMRL